MCAIKICIFYLCCSSSHKSTYTQSSSSLCSPVASWLKVWSCNGFEPQPADPPAPWVEVSLTHCSSTTMLWFCISADIIVVMDMLSNHRQTAAELPTAERSSARLGGSPSLPPSLPPLPLLSSWLFSIHYPNPDLPPRSANKQTKYILGDSNTV